MLPVNLSDWGITMTEHLVTLNNEPGLGFDRANAFRVESARGAHDALVLAAWNVSTGDKPEHLHAIAETGEECELLVSGRHVRRMRPVSNAARFHDSGCDCCAKPMRGDCYIASDWKLVKIGGCVSMIHQGGERGFGHAECLRSARVVSDGRVELWQWVSPEEHNRNVMREICGDIDPADLQELAEGEGWE